MEKKHIIELTEEEKALIENALASAHIGLKAFARRNRRKEDGSGIFVEEAERSERKAYKMLELFEKFSLFSEKTS